MAQQPKRRYACAKHHRGEEAEEIGVEHLLRDIRDTTAVGTLSTRVSSQLSSLRGLQSRLLEIRDYLQAVVEGKLPSTTRSSTIFRISSTAAGSGQEQRGGQVVCRGQQRSTARRLPLESHPCRHRPARSHQQPTREREGRGGASNTLTNGASAGSKEAERMQRRTRRSRRRRKSSTICVARPTIHKLIHDSLCLLSARRRSDARPLSWECSEG